jgi:hypothetical protein
MNTDDDENRLGLIPRPDISLSEPTSRPLRIMSEMIEQTLAIARLTDHGLSVRRFTIGEQELCEPDFQQILIWSKTTGLEPVEIIRRLELVFFEGRITKGTLDFSVISSERLQWVEGLQVKELSFGGGRDPSPHLPLAELQNLYFYPFSNEFTELDLSGVPKLKNLACLASDLVQLNLTNVPELEMLDCCDNQLTHLDLSPVPKLKFLCCGGNNLDLLDIRSLSHLKRISYDRDKTRLIQRSDQHF